MNGGSPTAQDDTAHGWYPVNQLAAPPIIQRLEQLIPSVQNDPDFLLTLPEYPRIVLESPSVSGGKFWLGVAMENGLSIRWGKMGTQGTLKHFSLGQCKRNNPVLELKHRLMGKMNNGCQSSRKFDPPCASKNDPPLVVVMAGHKVGF